MKWNKHLNLEGAHAFLSPSKHSWIRYSDEKVADVYTNTIINVEKGTRLHALACEHIQLGIPMPRKKETLCMYINDAIGYRMSPEVVLYASDVFFGTTDAISFRKEPKISKDHMTLRIHDLKTGVNKASMEQLDVYAALFCLEYDVNPKDIVIEERIYQNNEIVISNPNPDDISEIMRIGMHFSDIITGIKEGETL